MKAIAKWFRGIAAFYVLAATASYAQTVDVKALAEIMKQGGYVIVFRHGATNRDQADTDPLNLPNVSKQRLLSESGRPWPDRSVHHSRLCMSRLARSTQASSIER